MTYWRTGLFICSWMVCANNAFSSQGKTIYDELMQMHRQSSTTEVFLKKVAPQVFATDRIWFENHLKNQTPETGKKLIGLTYENSTFVIRDESMSRSIKLVDVSTYSFLVNDKKINLPVWLTPEERIARLQKAIKSTKKVVSWDIFLNTFVEDANATDISSLSDVTSFMIASFLAKNSQDVGSIKVGNKSGMDLIQWAGSMKSGCTQAYVAQYMSKLLEYGVRELSCEKNHQVAFYRGPQKSTKIDLQMTAMSEFSQFSSETPLCKVCEEGIRALNKASDTKNSGQQR